MTGRLRRWLWTGVLTITPVAVTLWVMWRLLLLIDRSLRPALERVAWVRLNLPPLLVTLAGVILLLALLTVVGMLAHNLIGRALFGAVERLLNRIPVVKGIFSITKQIAETLLADHRAAFQKVVLFEYPRRGLWSLGFVTHDDPAREHLHVFLPTTPNPTSGYLLLVPRREARELPLGVEDAVRLIVSGGAVVGESEGALLDRALPAGGGTDERRDGEEGGDGHERHRADG